MDGWAEEWAEEWVGGGRGRVYEAYEVKNKRQKLRCLLPCRKKNFLFVYEVITWGKKKLCYLVVTYICLLDIYMFDIYIYGKSLRASNLP